MVACVSSRLWGGLSPFAIVNPRNASPRSMVAAALAFRLAIVCASSLAALAADLSGSLRSLCGAVARYSVVQFVRIARGTRW